MIISHDLLERTCKNMIETILLCLENATRGTIYRIGMLPRLQAVRVTSGERVSGNGDIKWGLPEVSDYNHPGKSWEQYRDYPGNVLEAMGWCVERQKSWTADDPYEDIRSVRKQLRGEIEDFYHMEPVLVRKTDLGKELWNNIEYARDWQGSPIWQDTEYIVVAVIKIHFLPYTIRRGDRSTKIIKKLSRILGTELLSLFSREVLADGRRNLTQQRLQTCNALAHEMRNTLAKLSFIFSAINAEISFLREQWELQLYQAFPDLEDKKAILERLTQLLVQRLPQLNGNEDLVIIGRDLIRNQEKLAKLSLAPTQGETWIKNKLRHKWYRLLTTCRVWEDVREEVQTLLDRLEKRMWLGMDEGLIRKMDLLPEDLKNMWIKIAYSDFSTDNLHLIDEMLRFLEHPALSIPHQQQTRKILVSLKALVDLIPEMEERANRMIFSLRAGDSADCTM